MNKENNDNERQIIRAKIVPSDDNAEYDFACIAVPTENRQLRYSYQNNEYFYQVLRTMPENVKSDRMEIGLPLFDNHPEENSAENQLGITTGFEFSEKGILVRCKFGARADEALRSDVKNGIVKTVSIEGEIINYSIERKAGEIPVYYAELWEPTSLSFAPVPNDIGAQIDIKRALQEQIEKDNTNPNTNTIKSIINKF